MCTATNVPSRVSAIGGTRSKQQSKAHHTTKSVNTRLIHHCFNTLASNVYAK